MRHRHTQTQTKTEREIERERKRERETVSLPKFQHARARQRWLITAGAFTPYLKALKVCAIVASACRCERVGEASSREVRESVCAWVRGDQTSLGPCIVEPSSVFYPRFIVYRRGFLKNSLSILLPPCFGFAVEEQEPTWNKILSCASRLKYVNNLFWATFRCKVIKLILSERILP